MFVYHRVPDSLAGEFLCPLNMLRDTQPELYAQHIRKYEGREFVLSQTVPNLGCLWNDVLHFSPVHPKLIVEAMSKLTEIRDPYTAGHQRAVGELCAAIGEELGLDRHTVDGLQVAGHLHDLGKVGVPSEILVKPGRLSSAEMALVRTHCQLGLDIIDGISFPWDIARPIVEHHERLDGSGYPHGLAGDQIGFSSRVVMVADVVEAMSSPRPYRSTWSVESAVAEIRLGAGRLYDEAVVEACCSVIAKNGGRLPHGPISRD